MKCRYIPDHPGLVLDHEAVITFKTKAVSRNPKIDEDEMEFPGIGREWCIINKDLLVLRQDHSGLVKLTEVKLDEARDLAIASLYNSPDGRVERYVVPFEEIVVSKEPILS